MMIIWQQNLNLIQLFVNKHFTVSILHEDIQSYLEPHSTVRLL